MQPCLHFCQIYLLKQYAALLGSVLTFSAIYLPASTLYVIKNTMSVCDKGMTNKDVSSICIAFEMVLVAA